jgi:hypothetical protein
MLRDMPTMTHEALIALFRNQPTLATTLLGGPLGVELPAFEQVRVEPADYTELVPTEYRADTIVIFSKSEKPVLAVVVEVQLRRDLEKRFTWPVYLINLRARLRCRTILLVVSTAEAAAWCGQSFETGHPGWTLTPLVVGPDRVPVVTDIEQARDDPELAVLSALAHGADPDGSQILNALVGAIEAVDEDRGRLYTDVVLAVLPEAAQKYLEKLMTISAYQFQSNFARRNQALGETKAVLLVLENRGIEVSDEARARITECTDLEQVDAWLHRAFTVTSVDELFN